MSDQVVWTKPGPGTWMYDGGHGVGPTSRVAGEIMPAAIREGFRQFCADYGLPISHMELAFVNGYMYRTACIAGVPQSDRPPPPAWLMRILVRAHPEFRRRDRRARDCYRSRGWRADLDRWETTLRPARIASNESIQAVDVHTLDDSALADHLDLAAENLASGLFEHFSLIGSVAIPIGILLVRAETNGVDPTAALGALQGAAAQTTGATMTALRRIADALAAAGVKPESLDDVRNASPESAQALADYLHEYGERIIGRYDVTAERLVELPEVVLRSIVAATEPVPPAATDEKDEVVVDARRAFASRDDHSGISGMWSLGLLRRALLEAGQRLAARGALRDAVHVFNCDAGETAALLRGAAEPTVETIAARHAAFVRAADAHPPEVLGREFAPPDPALFPEGLRTMSIAMFTFLGAMDGAGKGEGIGETAYRGRAVVAPEPADAIERLEPGDVLVTSMTTPACNAVLPFVGALVTVHGGQLSHAGIMARELGFPAVLGVRDALERIPDGAEVEVDPIAGVVRVC